jgi:hypothetical protein
MKRIKNTCITPFAANATTAVAMPVAWDGLIAAFRLLTLVPVSDSRDSRKFVGVTVVEAWIGEVRVVAVEETDGVISPG